MKKLEKIFRFLVYALPVALFFSYWPVISLGGDATMNFELSVPLIWLVLFDVLVVVMMVKRREVLKNLKRGWVWLLLPLWLSVSLLWSLNPLRGALTVGVVWLLYMAGYGIWSLRDLLDKGFWQRFWWVFFGASLVACAWCLVQCVLDLAGVGREWSLMCAGCTYQMFGFPHPNGFAIEPQFMGNLLLAPVLVAAWFIISNHNSTSRTRVACARRPKVVRVPRGGRHGARALILGRNLRNVLEVLLLIALTITLFLTFSRGAIYALVVGLVVMSVWGVVREKKGRGMIAKRVGLVWGATVVAFVAALNIQGLMAQVSPTNDTYQTGVMKVLNHLSLGVIDIGGGDAENGAMKGGVVENDIAEKTQALESAETEVVLPAGEEAVVENPVENSESEEAVFDGYVAESTDTRLRLTNAAVQIWSSDLRIALFGVGLGGAGQALYVNGLSPAPKEIVQNQYASLLLETGLIGVLLAILSLVLAVRAIVKRESRVVVISLMVAYGVTLLFFSGVPNALHIYLLLMLLTVL